MHFASDNSGPVPPQVLAAVTKANQGYAMGYGADPMMEEVRLGLRRVFDAPQAEVFLCATGTAANVLALSTLCQPFETIFCTPTAHIHEDECNAPEFYTGGAKLTLVGDSDRMTPEALRISIEGEETRGVHGPQRGPVSITNVTERGNVYSLEHLRSLTAVAKEFGLPVHLDGARFANACVTLGCTPADMTWKSGVDVAVFGGTKNGLMGVEAVVFFDPAQAATFELRRKRGGHLFSKHRYLSAQMAAYLRDNLWLELAQTANARMARLAEGLRGRPDVTFAFGNDPSANMLFATMPRALHDRARAGGAVYHMWQAETGSDPNDLLTCRLVTDWSISEGEIDQFLALLAG